MIPGRHFADILKCIFMSEKYFTEVCPKGSNWKKGNIGSGTLTSLVPNRRQATIWTNCNTVYRRIYTADLSEL